MIRFVWSRKKAESNTGKHGVSFEEARTVFEDDLAATDFDRNHSKMNEDRFAIIGVSNRSRLLYVVYTEDEDNDSIRIISARETTKQEQRDYEKGTD